MDSQKMAFVAKNWRALIRPRELVIEDRAHDHARLSCEPLERGFGTTLGMALRRTLLSALPGAAITHVAFDGSATTELDEILVELKGVVFSTERAGVVVRLDVQGPRVVTARDIALVDGITCHNPEYRICVLAASERIALRLSIGVGRGYAPAGRHEDDLPDGVIAIDALFSPVRSVEFAVTNARVGHQTDFDRLVIDVSTNGSIDPVDAVARAAAILRDQVGTFINFEEVPEPVEIPRDERADTIAEHLWRTIEDLELSVRASNCLRNLKVTYIGELVQKSESELMKSRGFGRKSLTEITQVLGQLELHLGMKLDGWTKSDPGASS